MRFWLIRRTEATISGSCFTGIASYLNPHTISSQHLLETECGVSCTSSCSKSTSYA